MSINSTTCRLCLKQKKPKKLKSIFTNDCDSETIENTIFLIAGVKINFHSELPSKICHKCSDQINLAKTIRNQCITSDQYWKKYLEEKNNDDSVQVKEEPSEMHDPQNTQKLTEVLSEERLKVEFTDYPPDSESNLFPAFDSHFNDSFIDDRVLETKIVKKRKKEPDVKLERTRRRGNKEIGPFQCVHCGKILQTGSGLASHEKSHTQFGKPERRNACFICDFCGKQFIQKSYLYVHLFSTHVKHDKGFKCEYCNRFFYKRVRYTNHINSHKNIRNFSCALCPKTFIQKRNLDVHMRVHSGERPYQCQYCEKSYAHHSDRKRHVMMAHTGERPYVCKVCGKGYVKRSCLTAHEKTHGVDIYPPDIRRDQPDLLKPDYMNKNPSRSAIGHFAPSDIKGLTSQNLMTIENNKVGFDLSGKSNLM